MSAIILDYIPFTATLDTFVERMRIQNRRSAKEELAELLEEAIPLARPKVMFLEAKIAQKGDGFIVIEGLTLTSQALRETVDALTRVFPVVVTCGTELATWASGVDGLFSRFCADVICEAAMCSAQEYLTRYVAERFSAAPITYILPGTLDWPMEAQKQLFTLVGDTEPIGVTLTAHNTMRPIKTVSALYYEQM